MEENNVVSFSEQEVNDGKVFAILMVIFPFLFFLPMVMADKKNNAYLKHYANQALLMLIAYVVASFVNIIPILGQIVSLVASIFLFVCFILLLIGAINGQPTKAPLFGTIVILK